MVAATAVVACSKFSKRYITCEAAFSYAADGFLQLLLFGFIYVGQFIANIILININNIARVEISIFQNENSNFAVVFWSVI